MGQLYMLKNPKEGVRGSQVWDGVNVIHQTSSDEGHVVEINNPKVIGKLEDLFEQIIPKSE